VLPDPEAEVRDIVVPGAGPASLDVEFTWRARRGSCRCRVQMRQGADPPRPAAYGFDGRMAHRMVVLPEYRLSLEAEGRSVPMADPTPLRVARFLSRISSGAPAAVDPAAVPGMRLLQTLYEATARA